jgi:hypothetical protein
MKVTNVAKETALEPPLICRRIFLAKIANYKAKYLFLAMKKLCSDLRQRRRGHFA